MSNEPQSKPLSGGDYVSSKPLQKSMHYENNNKSDQQFITFDFFVNLSADVATENKIMEAIAKSVDCDMKQISSVKIEDATSSGNKSRLRISGKVLTNDWEIPQLSQKFSKLVTDRILSGTLQELLQLEERPRVSRFYSKSSTTHIPSINTVSPTPYDQHDNNNIKQSSQPQAQQQSSSNSNQLQSSDNNLTPNPSYSHEKPQEQQPSQAQAQQPSSQQNQQQQVVPNQSQLQEHKKDMKHKGNDKKIDHDEDEEHPKAPQQGKCGCLVM